MKKLNIVIISPFSPKWSNIASIRWERLAKYLSQNNNVNLITSSFPESGFERSFDVGNATLIEIPLKFYQRNPFINNSHSFSVYFSSQQVSLFKQRLKTNLNYLLERIAPISSGGIIYHDISSYKSAIEKNIYSSKNTILITTYGPWFVLKLGNYFKQKYKNLIWIADFRDPSFNIPDCIISKLIFFKKQTKKILTLADLITVVTKDLKKIYQDLVFKKVVFIPNGFDGSLFLEENNEKYFEKKKNSLTITYTGSLIHGSREISYFVEALKITREKAPNINFIFNYAGKDYRVVAEEFSKRKLDKILKNYGMLNRDQAINLQYISDILLLIVYTGDNPEEGKSIRTGKVYEYLATDKPILVIGPKNWEMRDEIECDGISKVFEKSQINEIADYLIELAQKEKIEINIQKRKEVLERYLYKNLATKLEKEIESLLNTRSDK